MEGLMLSIIIFIRMSLKDFDIGTKLGTHRFMQARELIQSSTKSTGKPISRATPSKKSNWPTSPRNKSRMPSTKCAS